MIKLLIATGITGMLVMPTAIYGLFHMDSVAFIVTKFVFALA